MENVVLFGHLLGVLAFAAGIVVAAAAFESARQQERAQEIALLLGLSRVGAALVGLGALLLFVCGLWLVELAEVGFGTGWIIASIVLFLAAMGLGGLGGQQPKRARQLAERLAREGRVASDQLRALLDDPLSRWANVASSALVLVVLALMVFKP
ncbi:MAG TPA: DUF2269 family protein, partial [Solirubrobacterales bacterium]